MADSIEAINLLRLRLALDGVLASKDDVD